VAELELSLTPMSFRTRVTAHEFVRETLREGILNGSLPGGTRLVQANLAAQLQVSTTPIREALRDLASEGQIELDAHRGATVHQISNDELEEIYELRMMLEVMAMRRAAERITPKQLERVRTVLDAMQAAPQSANWVMLNRDFHMTIYEAANSPRLLGILRSLLDTSVMYVSAALESVPDIREQAGIDHENIVEVLVQHDVEGAVRAIQDHLNIPRSILHLDA
jgi:DNA-binding GntR family transcriptional regulator|tara:strand:- start:514 stop:1182 length:669 start_codon:yes stop_codon:yes gene_type:complete